MKHICDLRHRLLLDGLGGGDEVCNGVDRLDGVVIALEVTVVIRQDQAGLQGAVCQCASMSRCQYVSVSICQYVNVSICKYVKMSRYQGVKDEIVICLSC